MGSKKEKHLDTHVCQGRQYCVLHINILSLTWHWEELREEVTNSIFWPTVGNLSQCLMCVHLSAQVCRGNRAGRRTDRRTGYLWGQGLGGVLAGTTPDSNLGGCGLAVLYIHVTPDKISTCWAGETTVPALGTRSSIQDKKSRMEHFLPPVLPCPSNAHWADKSGQLWWLLVGLGWRCQPCQCQRWEQSCVAPPDLGLENKTWMPLF